MSLLSAISDGIDGLFRAAPRPPGGSTLSGSWLGGPATVDAYGARRAPTPYQLVEAYKSLIYACVQINANAVSQVPLRLYADGGKGDGAPRSACMPRGLSRREWTRLRRDPTLRSLIGGSDQTHEINLHPILDTLEEPDPDGYFDKQQLIGLICRYVDVIGVAYLKPDGAPGIPPQWLWPLASQYVVAKPMGNSPLISGYTYFGDTYGFDELIRFRLTPSLKDPYKAGYCATYAALEYGGLEDEWVSIQRNTLSNGARMSMMISAADATMPISEDAARRLERGLDMHHARGNSGKPWVVRDAVTATPLNWPPGDMAGLEVSKNVREQVGNCFGIPAPYLSGETNLANLQAARTYHASNAIEPRCAMIAAVLTRLVRRYDPRLFFAFDSAVPEDDELNAKILKVEMDTGVLTLNEERAERNLDPVAWGDEPWLLNTLQQPSMAIEAHDQSMASAKAGDAALAKGGNDAGGGNDNGTPAAGGDGPDGGGNSRSLSTVHVEALDSRFDAVLTALEREVGL